MHQSKFKAPKKLGVSLVASSKAVGLLSLSTFKVVSLFWSSAGLQ